MTAPLPPRRRDAVMAAWPEWNGLDDVQVSEDQLTLTLTFLGKAPAGLRAAHVRIDPAPGGPPGVRPVRVLSLHACRQEDRALDDCVQLRVDHPGGWNDYRLCLVALDARGRPTDGPFPGFDPRLAWLTFNFKVNCPSEVDCAPAALCSPSPPDPLDVNYLARDYASLRQLLFDRLAATMPQWRERHAPDVGVTLVELLAFAGDRFSAAQDAVATEAYLDTARLRRSVRRHARLMDYRLHDGCNARTFIQVQVSGSSPVSLDPAPGELQFTSPDGTLVFEPLFSGPFRWWPAQNEIPLYSWGDGPGVLGRGVTRVSLHAGPLSDPLPQGGDNPLHLHAGDWLLLEEVLGPRTGRSEDARPDHRQVVRLTHVSLTEDPLYGVRVLEVEWDPEDALTFDLCLTGRGLPPECRPIFPAAARGNLLPADHGATAFETLPPVPVLPTVPTCEDCDCGPPVSQAGPYAPTLTHAPLTVRQDPPSSGSAASLLRQDPRLARPDLTLTDGTGAVWTPLPDLLEGGPDGPHFVVEAEADSKATLRFGRNGLGRAPTAGITFTAHLRVGSGGAGNIGPGILSELRLVGRLVPPPGVTLTALQPLAAQGGQDPEVLGEARQRIPVAFRQDLRRAVTPEDYALLAGRLFAGRLQRAAATLVWNGVGDEVILAVDPLGDPGTPVELLQAIRIALEPYRRVGHSLTVEAARTVGLDLELEVCLDAHAPRARVRAALLERLGTGLLPDGTLAFFHPDNLSFAQPVSLSRVVAAAAAVPGISNVTVTSLRRHDRPHDPQPQQGELPLGPTEIARLDNDPHRPDHGRLTLTLRGGR